jgi:hypothetical protein
MPAKFTRCVRKVKASKRKVNPYAVCRVSTGFYGSTHHAKMKHKKAHKKTHKARYLKAPKFDMMNGGWQ